MPHSRCPCIIHAKNKPPAPFRFFDLPPEIREQITILVVSDPSPIIIHRKRFNRHPNPARRTQSGHIIDPRQEPSVEKLALGHSRLALLLTSRRAYNEGWKLYYGKNTFSFTLDTFTPFCVEIPTRCQQQIRSIRFVISFKDRNRTVWRMLADLDILENLEIQMKYPISMLRRPKWEHCVWGTRGIRKLKGFQITRSEPGISRPGFETSLKMAVQAQDRVTEEEIKNYIRSCDKIARTSLRATHRSLELAA